MTLFEHQTTGAQWLAPRRNALLGDEPGLGKTRTLLAALDAEDDGTLVVCPAIARTVWRREAEVMNVPLPLVFSYEEIVRGGESLMKTLLRDSGVTRMLVDEFHYGKRVESQRAQIIFGNDGYARRVPTWGASGTPMPRHPAELWPVLCSLFPEVVARHGFTTLAQWKEHFCITRSTWARGQWREKVVGQKNVEQLRAILGEVMLRRTLDDVGLDVPELFFQTLVLDADTSREVPIPGHLMVAIQRGELEAVARDPHVARMRRRLGELKVAPVVEMLSQQLEGSDEKVVVFAHHTEVLRALDRLLGAALDCVPAYVDGDVRGEARDNAIKRFQEEPNCRVFIGQNIACQTAISLTAARRAILVEPDWTPDVNLQLGKRIARIGSKSGHCIAQMVTLAGTLDEAIVAQNLRETRMVNEVLSS